MTIEPHDHKCSEHHQMGPMPGRAQHHNVGPIGSGYSGILYRRSFMEDDLQLKGVCVVDVVFPLNFMLQILEHFFS